MRSIDPEEPEHDGGGVVVERKVAIGEGVTAIALGANRFRTAGSEVEIGAKRCGQLESNEVEGRVADVQISCGVTSRLIRHEGKIRAGEIGVRSHRVKADACPGQ